jgi:hypothetical protein
VPEGSSRTNSLSLARFDRNDYSMPVAYLKRLKLATVLKEYAAVAKLCGQERADYLIF